MRIWLDDERPMPDGYDLHIRSVTRMIYLLALKDFKIDFISFDHDLGDHKYSGYDVAKYIEYLASLDKIDRIEWAVHSANPVGKKNIESAMNSAERFWANRDN